MAKGQISPEKLSAESQQFYNSINDEKDLAVILIASSFLDACLKALLESYLHPGNTRSRMLSSAGALGTFQARADAAYVLGLLPKEWFTDLTTIGEIRNRVAHDHVELSFAEPEISALTHKLGDRVGEHSGRNDARSKFKVTAVLLANMILMQALSLNGQPRPEPRLNFQAIRIQVKAKE